VALNLAPTTFKDAALISLANVLHASGRHNDAIMTTAGALDMSTEKPVSHLTLANLYADKVTMVTIYLVVLW
jgi:hypothetical protein